MVCLCHGVNERRIRKEIDHGARTVAAVTEACDAGGCCHSCHPTIEHLLHEQVPEAVAVRRGRRVLRFA